MGLRQNYQHSFYQLDVIKSGKRWHGKFIRKEQEMKDSVWPFIKLDYKG